MTENHLFIQCQNLLLDDFKNNFPQTLESIEKTVSLIKNKSNPCIYMSAVGKSAFIARWFSSILKSIGISSQYLHPVDALHGDIGQILEKDVVFFLSYGGHTDELTELFLNIQKRGSATITLSSSPIAPLSQSAQIYIPIPLVKEPSPIEHVPLMASMASLSVCSLLITKILESLPIPLEVYKKNHPYGKIGKNLLKVQDIMTVLKDCPIVSPETSAMDCLHLMTQKAMGCLLVSKSLTEPQSFVGLIAEKELRIAMEKFHKTFFEHNAEDFLNSQPLTLKPQTSLKEARLIMENPQRILNIIPVVDDHRQLLGLLRLHDIIRLGIV